MAYRNPMQRLTTNTTTECLWPYVLALMRDEPAYAYEIRQKVSERYGFEVGQVAAYMVLYNLEGGGYVKTEWRTVDNRQRKYYRITDEGVKALNEAVKYLAETVSKLRK